MMHLLNVSPLPSPRFDDVSGMPAVERDGFVDDAVVVALLAIPSQPRQIAPPAHLALAADDMDFAGWCLPGTQPAAPAVASPRCPAPPILEEPGLGEPYRGHHRWWLAGLAGALSTLLLLLAPVLPLLTSIPSGRRSHFHLESRTAPRARHEPQNGNTAGRPRTHRSSPLK